MAEGDWWRAGRGGGLGGGRKVGIISNFHATFAINMRRAWTYMQCWKRPVAQWPNAPNFCLGPPEITKLWTLVAQIYLSGNSKGMRSSASGYFGPLKCWSL